MGSGVKPDCFPADPGEAAVSAGPAWLLGWSLMLGLAVFAAAVTAGLALARSPDPDQRGVAGLVKSGTGFFVSHAGFVLTSAHVVSGCQDVSVSDAEGNRYRSHVVAIKRRLDVALLWAEGIAPDQVAAVSLMPARTGEAVVTLGYGVIPAQPLRPVLVEGSLIGDRIARAGHRIVMVKANLKAGNSGGALLASDGALLGMIVGRDKEHPMFGVAIPKEEIQSLLSTYRIALPPRPPAPKARDLIAGISVLLQCAPPAQTEPVYGSVRN